MKKSADNYWEAKYKFGNTKEVGCTGRERQWRWRLVNGFVKELNDVIDIGCGNLSFWEGKDCKKYIGTDISETVLEKDHNLRPDWIFINANASTSLKIEADVVFCFDVLLHIMDEEEYQAALKNLTIYSKKWLFISTWQVNPFTSIRSLLWDIAAKVLPGKRKQPDSDGISRRFQKYLQAIHERQIHDDYRYFRSLKRDFPLFRTEGFKLRTIRSSPSTLGMDKIYVFERVSNYQSHDK